jgi:hypothetical protein
MKEMTDRWTFAPTYFVCAFEEVDRNIPERALGIYALLRSPSDFDEPDEVLTIDYSTDVREAAKAVRFENDVHRPTHVAFRLMLRPDDYRLTEAVNELHDEVSQIRAELRR